ncbi:MAG TPA: energy transducer TonB, partial [Burkholderiales bacterium]|nr:energy transducer TonB [Burkholderiales bacterium]
LAQSLRASDSVAPVTPPRLDASYLRNPPPRYPLAARRAGEQGTVLLRVLVARDGQPARVELERSSGSRHLDAAALEAVKAWRFIPARRGTEPLESWVLVPIVFRLEG